MMSVLYAILSLIWDVRRTPPSTVQPPPPTTLHQNAPVPLSTVPVSSTTNEPTFVPVTQSIGANNIDESIGQKRCIGPADQSITRATTESTSSSNERTLLPAASLQLSSSAAEESPSDLVIRLPQLRIVVDELDEKIPTWIAGADAPLANPSISHSTLSPATHRIAARRWLEFIRLTSVANNQDLSPSQVERHLPELIDAIRGTPRMAESEILEVLIYLSRYVQSGRDPKLLDPLAQNPLIRLVNQMVYHPYRHGLSNRLPELERGSYSTWAPISLTDFAAAKKLFARLVIMGICYSIDVLIAEAILVFEAGPHCPAGYLINTDPRYYHCLASHTAAECAPEFSRICRSSDTGEQISVDRSFNILLYQRISSYALAGIGVITIAAPALISSCLYGTIATVNLCRRSRVEAAYQTAQWRRAAAQHFERYRTFISQWRGHPLPSPIVEEMDRRSQINHFADYCLEAIFGLPPEEH